MEHNYELVKAVYQNAEMSKDILGRMIKICENNELRADLADEFAQYHEITCEAKTICDERGYPVKTKHHAKSTIFGGIAINTMVNKSASHIAEMLVTGSTMGVIDMKRSIDEYTGADETIKALAQKLMQTEQNNASKMLNYV